jgi:predicted histidine transporter YuiF (NhaC family)
LLVSFVPQCFAAYFGDVVRKKTNSAENSGEFTTILPAALTLLGLIVGFTFSMAVSRYDLRKDYEEAEANAIGTEYVRADLLPAAQAALVLQLLTQYLAQRELFYRSRNADRLEQINASTAAPQIAFGLLSQVPRWPSQHRWQRWSYPA